MSMRTVWLVPHTHWDREWYESFQTYRSRLVDVVDEVVELLLDDPRYPFLLDGQTGALTDYLEIRPEKAGIIRELTERGQLEIGPFHILMDEFLCSAETVVRNLSLGIETAHLHGKALTVGYLPDMFGHTAQMPQILKMFGIDTAVVWRGVPEAVRSAWFWWEAPDGSRVKTAYLYNGYSNGAGITDDLEITERIIEHELELAQKFEHTEDHVLIMTGTDHQAARPWLMKKAEELQERLSEVQIRVAPLSLYMTEAAPEQDLPVVKGELRSSARANLLMGVASNRSDLKAMAVKASHLLERVVEPLYALAIPPEKWPQALLEQAWLRLIQNSAHDSSCACSIDSVVDQVKVRYQEAIDIARSLLEKARSLLAARLLEGQSYVINLSPYRLPLLVERVLSEQAQSGLYQALGSASNKGAFLDITLDKSTVSSFLSQINSTAISEDLHVVAMEISEEDEKTLRVSLLTSSKPNPSFSLEAAKKKVAAKIKERPEGKVAVKMSAAGERHCLQFLGYAEPFSIKRLGEGHNPPQTVAAEESDGGLRLLRGDFEIEIDRDLGELTVNGKEGYCRLEDGGDAGDTYNYSPPSSDTVITSPKRVNLRLLERGPLRARAVLERVYEIPEQLSEDAAFRTGSTELKTTALIELRTAEPLVRISVEVENRARDHRLRILFPLPEAASESYAETAFGAVTRGLFAEGGTTERGLPTFPAWSFVRAGGLTVVHEGLHEYELIDIKEEGTEPRAQWLAITLLRATGYLSRPAMRYRPVPAGPTLRAEHAQMQGKYRMHMALCFEQENPWVLKDLFFEPLVFVAGQGGSEQICEKLIDLKGAVVSAMRRRRGFLEVRVFNPEDREAELRIKDGSGYVVDALGRFLSPFRETLSLGGSQILTLWLRDRE